MGMAQVTASRGARLGLAVVCLLGAFAGGAAAAERDCGAGKRLYDQARQTGDPARRIELLERSIAVCPTFEAWYVIGRTHQLANDHGRALDAYEQANAYAGNAKARALAMGRSGQCRAALGEAIAGADLLHRAAALHPQAPPWMLGSAREIELAQAGAVVSGDKIQRALASRSFGVVPAIRLRIHFAYDSAALDQTARRQVRELGRALTSEQFAGRHFVIVGHTDKRGSEAYNLDLSTRRARAVRRALEARFASLKGRLRTDGKGESELLYPGSSDKEHRLNRRVEVKAE